MNTFFHWTIGYIFYPLYAEKGFTQETIDVFANTESLHKKEHGLYYELRLKLLNKASFLINNIFDLFFIYSCLLNKLSNQDLSENGSIEWNTEWSVPDVQLIWLKFGILYIAVSYTHLTLPTKA